MCACDATLLLDIPFFSVLFFPFSRGSLPSDIILILTLPFVFNLGGQQEKIILKKKQKKKKKKRKRNPSSISSRFNGTMGE
jgi:hypothetical protein